MLQKTWKKYHSDEAVKAFLLHHILDYTATPPYSFKSRELPDQSLKEEAETLLERELKNVVLKACEEIRGLLGCMGKEILSDIMPEMGEWFE
ncbi:MAG TPA: hypothetical protein ENF26_02625 [Methanomicrobia archaeon]|nr:hypothetical protein [Candidatus Alkanophaga volatiphilum]HDO63433.1 hypothetical protein [Methanomicrobia archaeon]HEX59026.1 hypothetical protein [Methanomicrobia archaeon]